MPLRIWRTPLDVEKVELPEAEIYINKDLCKGCAFCIEFCPMNVLEKSEELNERGVHPPKIVDASKCVVCNFCFSVCPDLAIFVIEKPKSEA